jgi:predicted ATPase
MPARVPPYLLRLKIENYKSLQNVELELSALSVLVGPNGAGKTNLLDVIAFLGDSGRDDLGPALAARGGFDRVCFRGGKQRARRFTIEVEAAVTKNSNRRATDNYGLTVSAVGRPKRGGDEGVRLLLREESFLFKRTAGPGRRITIKGTDVLIEDAAGERSSKLREGSLGLASLPKLEPDKGGDQVDALLRLFASFRVFDIDASKARLPATTDNPRRLADDASNVASFLHYLSVEHPGIFTELKRDARAFVPGLEDLTFDLVGGATSATVLRLRERGLSGSTELAEASFGSIRALALLALLYDPQPPKLTCIEEIDHGLHPHLLDRLVELLRRASRTTQLLIATHSPSLVNRLRPEELIVCERGPAGASLIPAIDPHVVRHMEDEVHGELGLGELWFTGVLGGVPSS